MLDVDEPTFNAFNVVGLTHCLLLLKAAGPPLVQACPVALSSHG